MNERDAAQLIATAVEGHGGTWADIGAGDGTFTRALVQLLEPGSRVYAVDADAKALASVEKWASRANANVTTVAADFTQPFDLGETLYGMLVANALHFVRDAERVLARLVTHVRPGGRVVFVEYDRRGPNRWVPYPIDRQRLPMIAAAAGLATPMFTATRPSLYGGELYVAAMDRL